MYGLKVQKLLAQGNGYKQHALKGQKLLAQGNGYKQHALKGQKLLAQGNGYKQHALKGQKLANLQLFVRPPRVPFFSLRAYHFLRGLNLVNDCSKCHEIRNICTL